MSQVPSADSPFPGAANYPPPGPYAPPPSSSGGSLWKWIVGGIGVLVLMPCMCCCGGLAWSSTFKDLTLSNGQHMGGSPMNVKFDYAFNNDGSHGPLKSFVIVVQSAGGARREQPIGGGFGMRRNTVPMRGTWQFYGGGDVVGPEHKGAVTVWVESDDGRGTRSVDSNTLTIYPKS